MMNALFERLNAYVEGHGWVYTLRRGKQKAVETLLGSYHRRWVKEQPTQAELEAQRRNPPQAGLISLIIPVYNTRRELLTALLASIRAQSYENWEAILYDGCSQHEDTLQLLQEAAAQDARFRPVYGKQNLGIAGNTNAALPFVRGEYVALCDHDDLLSPQALWRVAGAIAEKRPDLIYSDEDLMTENGLRHTDPHYKPDFCPDQLMSDNYICHLAVIRRAMLEEVGGLRGGFDGSQDHDLFLRLTERTDKIVHLPYTLYTWRRVKSSASHRGLENCFWAACRAAEEAAQRRGRQLTAVPVNRIPRLWYDVPQNVSIDAVIYGSGKAWCKECFQDLEAGTCYPGLQFVPVETALTEVFASLNRAAEKSKADYLLFMDAETEGFSRHFFRELLMYAQRRDVAGVIPVLLDHHRRITHGGFALGMRGVVQGINTGLRQGAGGWHDMMNRVHNISCVSICCVLVRRDAFIPFNEDFRTGLGMADWCLRQQQAGRRFVYTPYAEAICEASPLLLRKRSRYAPDVALMEKLHGKQLYDPCYSPRFSRKKANYSYGK